MTLLEVMRLAADRDGIAREYATGFRGDVRDRRAGARAGARDGLSWDDAIVETFLTLLAAVHRHAHRAAERAALRRRRVSRWRGSVLAAGGVRSDGGGRRSTRWTAALRDARNIGQPRHDGGPDTAAAIFVVLLVAGAGSGGGSGTAR